MYSSLRHNEYDEHDAIRIVNPKQAAFYWGRGLQPLTIYPSKDHVNEEPILVFVFKKSDTKKLFSEWCERKPNG